jgi:hypothetical protein
MSDLRRPPTAMIVLAGEQLWPNLHGLVHWHKDLRHLCIYHTAEHDRSVEPARRLAELCRRLYPHVRVHRLASPGGIRPDEVRTQVEKWRQELPGQHWLINASGGNKLMFNGACSFAGAPDCDVVYRELSDDWFALTTAGDCLGLRPLDVRPSATDALDVQDLVRIFWATDRTVVEFGAPPVRRDVVGLTRALAESPGDWCAAFRRVHPADADPAAGPLFEQFIAAVALGLGVSQVALNVKYRSADGTELQEVDLIANHGGRLHLLDLKLRTEEEEKQGRVESITSQLRQAAHTRRSLGGLGARSLLVRPNRPIPADIGLLAKELQLTVLGPDRCADLIGELAAFFGVKELPPELQEAAREAKARPGVSPYCAPRRRVAVLVNKATGNAVANLDAFRDALGQDWVCYLVGSQYHFHCRRPAGATDAEVVCGLGKLLAPFGTVEELRHSPSGKTFGFRLKLGAGRSTALGVFLEGRLGRPLLD